MNSVLCLCMTIGQTEKKTQSWCGSLWKGWNTMPKTGAGAGL